MSLFVGSVLHHVGPNPRNEDVCIPAHRVLSLKRDGAVSLAGTGGVSRRGAEKEGKGAKGATGGVVSGHRLRGKRGGRSAREGRRERAGAEPGRRARHLGRGGPEDAFPGRSACLWHEHLRGALRRTPGPAFRCLSEVTEPRRVPLT